MIEDSPPCGLGDRLSHARQGGFFTWFCLSEVGAHDPSAASVDSGHDWRRFRPSGPRFHHLVELAVGLDESGRIEAARLGIARSFIETSSIRPFARDIGKSFLNWALPAEVRLELTHEIRLIGAFADGDSLVIAHPDAPRPRWRDVIFGSRSEAAVFAGQRTRSERRIAGTRISFENCDGAPRRRISAGLRGALHSTAVVRRGGWLFIRVNQE